MTSTARPLQCVHHGRDADQFFGAITFESQSLTENGDKHFRMVFVTLYCHLLADMIAASHPLGWVSWRSARSPSTAFASLSGFNSLWQAAVRHCGRRVIWNSFRIRVCLRILYLRWLDSGYSSHVSLLRIGNSFPHLPREKRLVVSRLANSQQWSRLLNSGHYSFWYLATISAALIRRRNTCLCWPWRPSRA